LPVSAPGYPVITVCAGEPVFRGVSPVATSRVGAGPVKAYHRHRRLTGKPGGDGCCFVGRGAARRAAGCGGRLGRCRSGGRGGRRSGPHRPR
jgi:hypothetical protein